MNRKLFERGFMGLLALLAAGMMLKEVIAPWMLRRWFLASIRGSCETCALSLERIRLSLFPPGLTTAHPRFTWGTPHSTFVTTQAERVRVPLSLLPLLSRRLRIGQIQVERPDVKVIEGDAPPKKPSNEKDDGDGALYFEIGGIEVKEGSFADIREHRKKKGVVQVSRINVSIGPIGTSERLRQEKAEGQATGILENTGKFLLTVSSRVFEKTPKVDVKLGISDQDLADLNHFFHPNDGIRLEGMLIKGESSVAMYDRNITASAYALFRDFGVKIEKTQERSAFSAFFQNLVASLKMGKQNVKGKNFDRRGVVEIKREPKQSLISFILTGMKEAAIKVASKGRK